MSDDEMSDRMVGLLNALNEDEIKYLLKIAGLIIDPLSQELLKKASEGTNNQTFSKVTERGRVIKILLALGWKFEIRDYVDPGEHEVVAIHGDERIPMWLDDYELGIIEAK